MLLLSKAISDILLADTDITDITGSGNIWHAKIPQQTTSGSTEPQSTSLYFYTYAVTPNDTKSGRSDLDTVMVRVHIIGTDDHQMNQVCKYVRYSLDRITPGEYSGIYIQGSRYLNGYYEPEGNYQLELQEWRLEFQFRVIDPEIRTPPSSPPTYPTTSQANVMFREKVTVTHADFNSDAAPFGDVDIFTLPIGGVVHSTVVSTTQAWDASGYPASDFTLAIGISGTPAKYGTISVDSIGLYTVANIGIQSVSATSTIKVTASSTNTNLANLNTGSSTIYIYYSILN
jgi:hypothetical protein